MSRKIIAGIMIFIMLISSISVQNITADNVVTDNGEVTYLSIKSVVGNSDVKEHQFMLKNGTIYVDFEWIRDDLGLVAYMDQSTLDDRLADAKEDDIQAVAKEYKETFAQANSNIEFKISKKDSELIYYFREGCKYAFAVSKYFGVYKIDIGESVVIENGFWFPLVGVLDIFDSYCYIRDDALIVGEPSTTVVDILHSRMFDGYYYDILSDYGENKLIFGVKYHYYDFYSRLKNYVQGALKFDTLQMRNALTYDELSDFLTLQICTFNTEEAEKYREGISAVSLLADLVGVTVDEYGDVASKVADGAIQRSSELNNALEQILKDSTGFSESDDYFKVLNKAVDATKQSDTASRILDKIDFASEILTHSLSFINAYTVYLSAIYEMNHTNYDAVSAMEVFLKYYRKNARYQEYNIGADGVDKKIDLYKKGESLFENDELLDRVAEKLGTSEIAAVSYSELYNKFPGTFSEVFPVLLVTTIGWDLLEGAVNKITNGSYDHLESALQMQYAMDFEKVADLIVHDYKNHMASEHTYDLDEYRKLEWMRLKSYYLARETMLMYSSKFVKKHPEEMEGVIKTVQEEEDNLLEHMGVLLSGIHMGRMPDDYEDYESKITTTNNKVYSELLELYKKAENEQGIDDENDPWLCICAEYYYGNEYVVSQRSYEYDQSGRCIYSHSKDMTGGSTNDVYETYSYTGNEVVYKQYRYGELYFSKITELDKDGREAKETTYNYDGTIKSIEESLYDGDNLSRVVEENFIFNHIIKTEYYYDGDLLVKESVTSEEKTLHETYYDYDEKGRLLKKETYTGDKKESLYSSDSYTYDETGKVETCRKILIANDGFDETILYNYDEFGNLISERNFNNRNVTVKYIYKQLSELLNDTPEEKPGFISSEISDEDGNENIIELLNEYVAQSDFMYGKSYTYTIYPRSQYNTNERDEWENISSDQLLGYTIKDFDDDGSPELLIVNVRDGYLLQFDMYSVIDGMVSLTDSLPIESDDGYRGPRLPCAEYVSSNNLSGLLSCFVSNNDHRIFLQTCDTLWGGGGSELFAISTIYKNGEFLDYHVCHFMGNGMMEFEVVKLTEELANAGVPDPDALRLFNEFLPLTEFFDEGTHEFLHAEQHTISADKVENVYTKVVSQTDFFTMSAK